jgi:hypothetical protein
MVNLVNLCSLMVRSCTKKGSNYALTNLLFGLCEFVWVINLLVNLPSPHPKISTHPSTLKMLWPRNVPQLLLLPLSSFLDSQLNPSKRLWVGHKQTTKSILNLYFKKIVVAFVFDIRTIIIIINNPMTIIQIQIEKNMIKDILLNNWLNVNIMTKYLKTKL